MEAFHKRWLGYSEARDAWVGQARRLGPKMIVPQHGLCFKDDDVGAFLDWLGDLEIGVGISVMQEATKLAEAPSAVAPLAKPVVKTPPSAALAKPASAPTSTPPVSDPGSNPQPGNADGTLVIKQDAPLFARIGGDPAVDVVVDAFYSHVLSDPRVARFFENIDTKHLKKMQKQFMAMAFGGPDPYTGQDMRSAHARLVADGLDGTHFDIVAKHLLDVLTNFQVDPPLVDEIMQIVGSTRDDVLNR